jgi:hypothetical protein
MPRLATANESGPAFFVWVPVISFFLKDCSARCHSAPWRLGRRPNPSTAAPLLVSLSCSPLPEEAAGNREAVEEGGGEDFVALLSRGGFRISRPRPQVVWRRWLPASSVRGAGPPPRPWGRRGGGGHGRGAGTVTSGLHTRSKDGGRLL